MPVEFIALLVALAGVFSLLMSRLLWGSLVAPVGVMSMVWTSSLLALAATTLEEAPLQPETWLHIAIAGLSFAVGAMLAGPSRTSDAAGGIAGWQGAALSLSPVMIAGLSLLALLGSLRFAYIVLGRVGLFGYLSNPMGLRHTLTVESVNTGILTYIFQAITMAAAVFGGLYTARRKNSWAGLLPLLAAALFDNFYMGRAHTLIVLLLFLSAYLLSVSALRASAVQAPESPLRRLRVVLLILLLVGLPYLRVSMLRDSPARKGYEGMLRPYLVNLSQNWYLVDAVIQSKEPKAGGANTILPILLVAHKLGLREYDPRHEQLFRLSRETGSGHVSNTYTIVGSAFADFGTAGVVGIQLLSGWASTLLFSIYKRGRSRLWQLAVLCFCYPLLVFSVQGQQLGSPQFNLGVILAVILSVFVQRRHKKQQGEQGSWALRRLVAVAPEARAWR